MSAAAIQELCRLSLEKEQEGAQVKGELAAHAQEIAPRRARLARLEQAALKK
jgi:hypothetical protein